MTHYYSEKQDSAYKPFFINVKIRGIEFKMYSASGMFSMTELDNGTAALLEYAEIPESSDNKEIEVLDLGCGNGIVGITLLKINSNLKMTFCDVSERAIRLADKNLQLHNLKGNVVKSDVFSNLKDKNFDVILTNPPYNAGRDVCYDFIVQSFQHLNKDGTFQLVARRRKGGDMLEKKMEEIFGNVEVLGQSGGFRLYKSIKV